MKDVNKLTKMLALPIKILMAVTLFFEIIRIVNQYAYIGNGSNIIPFFTHIVLAIGLAVVLILNISGNLKVPVYWFVFFVLNSFATFMTLIFINIESVEIIFGMPSIAFYFYFAIQIILSIIVGFYGWSLTLPTEAKKIEADKKGKDFGEFLKAENQALKS